MNALKLTNEKPRRATTPVSEPKSDEVGPSPSHANQKLHLFLTFHSRHNESTCLPIFMNGWL